MYGGVEVDVVKEGCALFLRVRGFLSEIGGMDSMLLGYGSAAGRTEFFLGRA